MTTAGGVELERSGDLLVTGVTDDVYRVLATRPSGLDDPEVSDRRLQWGPNTLAPVGARHLGRRLFANFVHVMALLLWVGGAVAFAAGLPELGVAIWAVNVINGLFAFWQEYRADRATEALRRLLPSVCTVLRGGKPARIEADGLVPGDVVLLAEGDRVSADGRLVEQVGLRVDQSTLTGESRAVRKTSDPVSPGSEGAQEKANHVFAGTTVVAGRGKAVVVAIGGATEFGKVASLTESTQLGESPLQHEMRRLSYAVSVVAVTVGVAFFAMALWLGGLSFSRGFIFTLGMIVAFVPEGLLPTVTLALAMATQRMARRQALVKKLSAAETLGSTTVICTDKTGTLTENEMTLRHAWSPDVTVTISGSGYEPEGGLEPAGPASDLARDLLGAAALCCDARLVPPGASGSRWSAIGDPTEAAIVVAARKAGWSEERLQSAAPRIGEVPFDPVRKRMSTIHRVDDSLVVVVKGAPTELVDRCSRLLTAAGEVALDGALRRQIASRIDAWSREGFRVLGVARRGLDMMPDEPDAGEIERDLTFLGLVAMHDPPRPEVAAAVETCRRAGIRIMMITGDYGLTAEAIGRRVGIYSGEEVVVVNGSELDGMPDSRVLEALTGQVLFARATPEQKLRVVTLLQQQGHVVAVTGDGVNDAPALKRADIGVAMGVVGTDVAKEAADMILLDDNFASIVAAVEEGRAVYANIKKFTTYILTSNTPEAVPFVAFALSGGRIPIALDVMHILAVDLGTDMAPALALGAEPPEPGVMDLPPRSRDDHVIDRRLLTRAYLWLGPLQAAFVMAAFFLAYRLAGYQGWLDLPDSGPVYGAATATALAAVVATQIGNLYTQRSERVSLSRIGLGGNRLLWWGVLSEVVLIVAIVYLPALNRLIGTAPVPGVTWLWLTLGIPLLPAVDEVRKYLRRRRR